MNQLSHLAVPLIISWILIKEVQSFAHIPQQHIEKFVCLGSVQCDMEMFLPFNYALLTQKCSGPLSCFKKVTKGNISIFAAFINQLKGLWLRDQYRAIVKQSPPETTSIKLFSSTCFNKFNDQGVLFLQAFSGTQNVSSLQKDEAWRVNVRIQGCDLDHGYLCGTMEALNVPMADTPVRSFTVSRTWDYIDYDNICNQMLHY